MFTSEAAPTVGAGGATLFFPIVPVSVVVLPPLVILIVTLIVPSPKLETSTIAPNMPRWSRTPLPDTEDDPLANV